ncbi:SAM-dependent methyltransferase [Bradyrhizobium sp. USDA 4524]|uniref:methyltransferase n=1 Tax=unclassified Bradyrhizobium TaxID=2631580 RepID=UPI00209F30AA|nr:MULTISPECIES: methyltransferase [unclassified Bradyrhizobium]MCP1843942.1 SAM-dependent methyltransferase [Bradyrhizobium sp. USDA 4538]MCP1904508.1 SAM-dependent methyltransferase [Bradyrhizobium sp. USDA 4537]MCP1989836.1 SAM-dependent methyltransferase [Bradyrhizobium sp. USDA 4539]
MAKLTKVEAKAHAEAVELLKKDVLTYDEKLFVLDNWHEGANHINGSAGAFFTPTGLAGDFAIDAGSGRMIDLCAGIGALAFHVFWRGYYGRSQGEPEREIVCIERDPAYVAVGRKVLPEAQWICADVFDFDLKGLGHFGCVIANPPFGATPRAGKGPRYTGRSFEFHVIDLVSDMADYGAFIIPQMSAPFEYSGAQCYRERKSADYLRFAEQTGIHLEAGCGVDCAYHRDGWKGVAPNVEIVCANFEDMPRNKARSSAEPEAKLRTIWSEKGLSVERQDALIAEIEAKAKAVFSFEERPVQPDLFTDTGIGWTRR